MTEKSISNEKNNPSSFMYYQSNIIVGLYTYLQEFNNKDIEELFSNAIDVFNALGSWKYGKTSPKIVYPELQTFIKKANDCSAEGFSQLLDYINWVGNKLYKNLDDNQWIEDHYYESFTLRKSNDITIGLFFLWRLGWLIVKMIDISNEKKTTKLLQSLKILKSLFDAIGGWIYNNEELTNITQSIKEVDNLSNMELGDEYKEIIEEALKTRDNIIKFLEKI